MAESAHFTSFFGRRVTALLFGTALLMTSAVPAQEADDTAVITALVNEAVDCIHTKAYRTEPKPVILTKALRGLSDTLGPNAKAQDKVLTGMSDEAASEGFMQALNALASAPGQRQSLRDLAETSLQAYCKQHDPYTKYTRSADQKQILLMNKISGSGIGMTINEKDGGLFCYPMPGTPAEVAGIKPGDKLLSVEGKSVENKPLEFLASVIRGAPGTEVSLRVEHGFGRAQSLKVTREALTIPLVTIEKRLGSYTLRTRRFSPELISETRKGLAEMSAGGTLTLDFRGCPGGNLDVAIEFAAMFLEPGEPIVTVRTRGNPDEVRLAKNSREFNPAAIIILQDEGTASAAELVIAALLNSKAARAVSKGAKTYGKGLTQTPWELEGGGSVRLSTGELIAPQGVSWDGIGLLPSLDNRGRIFPKAEGL